MINKRPSTYAQIFSNCREKVGELRVYWYEPIIVKLAGPIQKENIQGHIRVSVRMSIVKKDILEEVGVYVCDSLVGPSQQWLSKLILEASGTYILLMGLCWLFVTLWTIALQAPLSMGFSRPECWSGVMCFLPENKTAEYQAERAKCHSK